MSRTTSSSTAPAANSPSTVPGTRCAPAPLTSPPGDGVRAESAAADALDIFAALPDPRRWGSGAVSAAVDLAAARALRGDLPGTETALDDVLTLPTANAPKPCPCDCTASAASSAPPATEAPSKPAASAAESRSSPPPASAAPPPTRPSASHDRRRRVRTRDQRRSHASWGSARVSGGPSSGLWCGPARGAGIRGGSRGLRSCSCPQGGSRRVRSAVTARSPVGAATVTVSSSPRCAPGRARRGRRAWRGRTPCSGRPCGSPGCRGTEPERRARPRGRRRRRRENR